MANNGILGTSFDFSLLQGVKAGAALNTAPLGGDFLATLHEQLAAFKTQAMDVLLSSLGGGSSGGSDVLSLLLGQSSAAGGYNMALADPFSAYRMMSEINRRDVNYRAEYAEMTDLGAQVAALREEAQQLAGIDAATPDDEIHGRLETFLAAYNAWIDRFDEALAAGGLLAGTQAATVAQWELEQSIENIFNGAAGGVRGLTALGVSIDPVSNFASLDPARLNSALAANRAGAVAAIDEFSAHFARSAELLNADGNFIPNRLDNLARVIDYLNENKNALQAEFGLGAPARPNAEVARALAAYEAMQKSLL
ncbi:MAG: flagellar filament capping protein FliD [Betaproteobacteria bacterium]|nr:flagellar filament capping protein FliD [Betaproteobacteria bacterium]MCL2886636.1 flagellar filament capping protein FliD [Betaproteobacteria bacterium]